ncbi:MAG: class I SAM-dependent methyltransferase [Planctomycetota bacterium]
MSQSRHHGTRSPEPSVLDLARSLPDAPRDVLDLAAGSGRNTLPFLARGDRVVAVDRDAGALQELSTRAASEAIGQLECRNADLENAPWPLAERRFDVIVVINYLWRPLLPAITDSLAPGGVLLYETFAIGNEQYGRPRNPDFLLQTDELRVFASSRPELQELEFWQGTVGEPVRAVRQRLRVRRS